MARIIGIDLGTTNSCVSVLNGGIPTIITNSEGNRTTPSVVSFKDGNRLIGELAKRQAVTNPDTVFSVKSKMGYPDKIFLNNREYRPQEISAMILQALKKQAEDYLGEPVTKAVITVPAYFNDAQRQATKDAGRIAGLKVERIINEPTAAALAYGLDKVIETQTILVYDFGGGTFDVSILELDQGLFEVKATAGNNQLGGDNIDEYIVNYLLEGFMKETGVDLSNDQVALSRITEAAEKAKRELSGILSTEINLPFITMVDKEPRHLEKTLTRKELEDLVKPLIEKTVTPTLQAMEDAGLEPHEIDRVILVGGTTRMPCVVDTVKRITKQIPYKGVNPDEVVAMGAAIQGGVLSGEVTDLILVDVMPLSLGIQTAGGLFTKIIDRNTSIPVSQSKVFSTAADNQHTVNIHVLQGERPMAEDNKSLGNLKLTDILAAPRGVPQIEVTFTVDKNGIVSVKGKDLRTGKNQTIILQSDDGLTEDMISMMVREAEKNAEEDAKKVKEAEIINTAHTLLTQSWQTVVESKKVSTKEERDEISKLSSTLKEVVNKREFEVAEQLINELKDKTNLLVIKAYKEGLE